MNKTEPMASPESLRILCADLSLRCPGFAILVYSEGKVSIEKLFHLSSRKTKPGHGETLSDIYDLLSVLSTDVTVFVREKGFSRFPHETQAIFKVVGIADLVAWQKKQTEYIEIAPTTIKKLLTGTGKATKEEVADAQEQYVGRQDYATDDESDAVAVGIAWLLQENKL